MTPHPPKKKIQSHTFFITAAATEIPDFMKNFAAAKHLEKLVFWATKPDSCQK